jgi:hypothetical protein
MSTESAGNLLLANLTRARTLRAASRESAQALFARTALRTWQSQRLARTYPDLLASARYHDAAQFFLEDLYGPKDFSQRDNDIARIVPTLKKLLPEAALATIAQAVELDALSESLDAALIGHLQDSIAENAHEKDVSNQHDLEKLINEASYADAYRKSANQADRARQIAIVQELGDSLNRLTKIPMLAMTLKLMRGPASAAGLIELHEFLARGFGAFKKMGDAQEFLRTIVGRETQLMHQLFDGKVATY